MEAASKDRIKWFDTDGNLRATLKVGESNSGKSLILEPRDANANFIIQEAGFECDNNSIIRGRLTIGGAATNATNYTLDLRNTGGPISAPPTGFARIHYRGDLVGAKELRVAFPNGTVKTINNDA
jgi:hypothetical protein